MNKEKRRSLRQAESLLHKAQKIVEAVLDDEQDAYDNMPSGLQASMQGDLMEQAIDELDEATENIEMAIEHIENAK